jgi:hypothetical protein
MVMVVAIATAMGMEDVYLGRQEESGPTLSNEPAEKV